METYIFYLSARSVKQTTYHLYKSKTFLFKKYLPVTNVKVRKPQSPKSLVFILCNNSINFLCESICYLNWMMIMFCDHDLYLDNAYN